MVGDRKKSAGRMSTANCPYPRKQLNAQQRIPAQLKQIVINTDGIHSKQALPDLCNALLQLTLGR